MTERDIQPHFDRALPRLTDDLLDELPATVVTTEADEPGAREKVVAELARLLRGRKER